MTKLHPSRSWAKWAIWSLWQVLGLYRHVGQVDCAIKTSRREAPRRDRVPEPPQLDRLDLVPGPSLRLSPATLQRKLSRCFCQTKGERPFWTLHTLRTTIGEGCDVDQLVNGKLHPPALLPLHYDGPPVCLTLHSPFPHEQDLKILELLCLGKELQVSFMLGWKTTKCLLEFIKRRTHQNRVICKKQRHDSGVSEPDSLVTTESFSASLNSEHHGRSQSCRAQTVSRKWTFVTVSSWIYYSLSALPGLKQHNHTNVE